ncbi:hypothetical protein [Nocardioides sp.]|uniref:hypothetical protein n=1 Tax=Nocardioides sp. TaxID=35761 RepID=UPI00262AD70D|nr:hypothetical protein [Nocardioides sp.]MDI6910263.1 hypothetical protein [Nocardioides sp.]
MGALSRAGARIGARIAVAATLVAAAYAGLPAAPASAAGCASADGVTVVVDFHELGGGVQTACVADGGGQTASQLFPAAGFPLDYVQRQPGFVCRVSGKPADNPCVNTPPADAYWALYWSDGKSGRWNYATSGAGGQHVPDGGYVGFSWQGSDDSAPPGASPAPHPTASATPTQGSTQGPGHASSSGPPPSAHATPSGQAGASTMATTEASPSATTSEPGKRKRKPAESPSATTSGSATAEAPGSPSESPGLTAATSDPADPGDGGLPTWVAPAVIVLLFGAAGGTALVRRRRGAGQP